MENMNRITKLSRSVRERCVIITGAASGMGKAAACLFADEGAHVAAVDIQNEALKTVVDTINAAGGSARGWHVDLSDPQAIRQVVDEVFSHYGRVDVLINNAGICEFSPITGDQYEAVYEKAIRINLTAQVELIRAALPHLLKSGEGRIINVASTEGLGATALNSPYAISKHGVVGLTKSLAVELSSKGVTVNCICPGPINTGMTSGIDDENKRKFARRRVPIKRYGDPEEVAHAMLNLALPSSSYTTGVILPVDGGLTVQNT